MKVYLPTYDGVYSSKAFTSLKAACEALGVSYTAAIKGKRAWLSESKDKKRPCTKNIFEIEIIKQSRK